jgi:hypothetical protein
LAASDERNGRLVDEAIDAYRDWLEESAEVWQAFARWERADDGDAAIAFTAYRAALDREEHASRVYGALVAEMASAGEEHEPVAWIRRLLWP